MKRQSRDLELLDQFATAALQGRLASLPCAESYAEARHAKYAYDMANLMLIERQKHVKNFSETA